jgi:hypothetical protein
MQRVSHTVCDTKHGFDEFGVSGEGKNSWPTGPGVEEPEKESEVVVVENMPTTGHPTDAAEADSEWDAENESTSAVAPAHQQLTARASRSQMAIAPSA